MPHGNSTADRSEVIAGLSNLAHNAVGVAWIVVAAQKFWILVSGIYRAFVR